MIATSFSVLHVHCIPGKVIYSSNSMREASRNQHQGSLKQKHGGLNVNAKHMQHVIQGSLHARALAHNLLNQKPHPIHFPLERRLQGRVVLPPTPRSDF